METIQQCPVCDNTTFDSFITCNDYLITNQEFSIQQCKQCSFRMTSPRPDEKSIGTYYKSDQYVSHNDEGIGLVNTAYRLVRNQTLRSKLKTINRLNEGVGSILDVGCGTGTFLDVCKQGGWQVAGMEPDCDARKLASKKLGMPIANTLSNVRDDERFDIVTLWHVLEHIPNLNDAISTLYSLLNEKGKLIIAVPNSASYDAVYFKQYWAAYDVPRHLYHFTPSTIAPLLNRYGFTLIDTLPMVFDAYYIAMLSTKYKNGQTDYTQSALIGLKSNWAARKSGQYSSLTYVFEKTNPHT